MELQNIHGITGLPSFYYLQYKGKYFIWMHEMRRYRYLAGFLAATLNRISRFVYTYGKITGLY